MRRLIQVFNEHPLWCRCWVCNRVVVLIAWISVFVTAVIVLALLALCLALPLAARAVEMHAFRAGNAAGAPVVLSFSGERASGLAEVGCGSGLSSRCTGMVFGPSSVQIGPPLNQPILNYSISLNGSLFDRRAA